MPSALKWPVVISYPRRNHDSHNTEDARRVPGALVLERRIYDSRLGGKATGVQGGNDKNSGRRQTLQMCGRSMGLQEDQINRPERRGQLRRPLLLCTISRSFPTTSIGPNRTSTWQLIHSPSPALSSDQSSWMTLIFAPLFFMVQMSLPGFSIFLKNNSDLSLNVFVSGIQQRRSFS